MYNNPRKKLMLVQWKEEEIPETDLEASGMIFFFDKAETLRQKKNAVLFPIMFGKVYFNLGLCCEEFQVVACIHD